jgi:hypothetical protein
MAQETLPPRVAIMIAVRNEERLWRSQLSCALQQSTKTPAETQFGLHVLHVKSASLSQGNPKWIPKILKTASGLLGSVSGAL